MFDIVAMGEVNLDYGAQVILTKRLGWPEWNRKFREFGTADSQILLEDPLIT